MRQIKEAIQKVSQELYGITYEPILTRPDEQFGDYSTNSALQIAGMLGRKPHEVANELVNSLKGLLDEWISGISVAGPGFINFRLNDTALIDLLDETSKISAFNGKRVMIEHTDPNPFKPFHIGHAYSNTIGDALARLIRIGGAEVTQVSYHGDVGMHVAMAVWAMTQDSETEVYIKSTHYDLPEIATYLGTCYAVGATAFKENPDAADQIKVINKHIYAKDDENINKLYEWGKEKSFAYFDAVYQELGTGFTHRYLESETGVRGAQIVRENIPAVFEKSEGAVIYKGEQDGLHTRVFLNSQGLPTYEAKELGLAYIKDENDHPDLMVVVTANEIDEYFKVLTSVLKKLNPELGNKVRHISHGVVKLPGGKMSSRTGKVKLATDVLGDIRSAIDAAGYAQEEVLVKSVTLGALKYSFLKHRIGGDLIFDINESISLEGNSGPYLQYAHARAKSILRKSEESAKKPVTLEPAERSLARKIGEYTGTVEKAVNELMPHIICTYLYEVSQNFNRFYEHNRVIGDPRQNERVWLVEYYAKTLAGGLDLLGIPAPDKM